MIEINDLLLMSDNQTFDTCLNELSKFGKPITDGENYIYLKRDRSKFCLVAHLDTVHTGGFKVLKRKKNVIRNLNGILGADDRAGIFAIFQLLNMDLPPFDVIITNYEETGGIGAQLFVESGEFLPGDVELMIQLDRKGKNEFVMYDELCNEVFDYIESFGFKCAYGTFSDIAIIAPTYGISSINLSIGYTAEHTANEKLHLKWMYKTIDAVSDMLQNPIGVKYPPISSNLLNYAGYTGRFDDDEDSYTDYSDEYCPQCGELVPSYEVEMGECPWCMYDLILDGNH